MLNRLLTGLNIKQRLTLQFLILVSILFLFFSLSIYFFSKLYLNNRFFNRLQERAVITGALFIDLSAKQSEIEELIGKDESQALAEELVTIYDPQRDLIVISTEYLRENFHLQFINPKDTLERINNIDLGDTKVVTLKIKDYWVTISAKDIWGMAALSDLRSILMIMSMVALLFIMYISWYMADKAISPIARVGKQLEIIFPKNLSKRVKYPISHDEIGILIATINQLLDRVEESMNAQKLFVTNISHELKNPLTKIFSQIEILELKYRDNPEYHKQILSLRSDALALNQLTQALLNLANTYTGQADIPMPKIRIDETLLDAFSEFKRWNPQAKIKLDLDKMPLKEDDLIYNGNNEALKVVFKNLMDNACKFSKSQPVIVSLYEEQNSLKVSFFNDGEMIPDEEKGKIIQPFYRSDATAKGKAGHGVGLAIVNQILAMHSVILNINSEEAGTFFILNFPQKNDF